MNCETVREQLALRVGGDAEGPVPAGMDAHLLQCAECRNFHADLATNRARLRLLRSPSLAQADLATMRAGLFLRLEDASANLGWRIRLERFVLSAFRKPSYAWTTAILAGVFAAAVFTQVQWVSANRIVALGSISFEDSRTLRLPDRYREWVFVGSSTRTEGDREAAAFQNVYINPDAYREYTRTGKFPEGTVMVMESAISGDKEASANPGHYEKEFTSLKVSVKDSRFGDGWGYFEFQKGEQRARALPEGAGCLACHRDQAATDHVFTQFYPVLRAASAVL